MKHKLLSSELRFVARALLANQQGGRVLEQMAVSPRQPLQCRTILGIVVHAAAVFFGRQKLHILLPFIDILNNPAALNVTLMAKLFDYNLSILAFIFTSALLLTNNA
jgi:hypothetical protein